MSITTDDVKLIINTSLSDSQINQFISTAGLMLTRLVASCSTTFTSDEKDQIQLYITAHLITLREPLKTSEKFEGWSQSLLRTSSGRGILSTPYGDTANMLSQGCLQNMDLAKVQVLYI